jgi:hypothetical protein
LTVTIAREDLAWAGGLFAGEGSFSGPDGNPRASLNMIERDVVKRFQSSVGLGIIYGPQKGSGNHPRWQWVVYGFEDVQAVLAMLWPWLNERRRTRAKEVLRAAIEKRADWEHRKANGEYARLALHARESRIQRRIQEGAHSGRVRA